MATSQVRTRKRPAPGASPLSQTQSPNSSGFPQDQAFGWQTQDQGNTNSMFPDPTPYGDQNQNNYPMQSLQQTQRQLGNQVARRAPDQPVVPIHNYSPGTNEQWSVGDGISRGGTTNGWAQYDDLDQRALLAKQEAESKRKQIPPFIQKLSSFLDESRNTDLIRWSDSGNSFIVLDEDEFAKTLIPELFKHRNYASFVRQLNMYGFHKKVGLSDNSMRASERRNKNPSEYSNPYFKRGRPNLLWLIQKPKNPNAKGGKGGPRAKQEDYDEEVDETFGRDNSPLTGNFDNLDDGSSHKGRQNLLALSNDGSVGLPQDQLNSVRQELQNIRDNQAKIARMLNDVKTEHRQLYGQAKAFHDLHEKHDNSINAILTFLATVYSKNIDGKHDNMGDMFPGAIPATDPNRGNVVEMGDVRDQSVGSNTPKAFRRGPLLLEDGKKSPSSPDISQNKGYAYTSNDHLRSPAIQALSDHSGRSTASPQLKPEQNANSPIPQADIMSMLNNAFANNSAISPNATMDFSEALSHLQNTGGNAPLTPNQRQNMLQLMGDEYQDPSSTSSLNNALTSYPSGDMPMHPATQFDATSNNLDQLGHIIREQDRNIDTLSNTLTPLSPSGSIPGINSDVPYPLQPGQEQFDLDNLFDTGGYFGDGGGKDGEFNFDENFEFGSNTNADGGATGGDIAHGDAHAGAEASDEVDSPATVTGDLEVVRTGKRRRIS